MMILIAYNKVWPESEEYSHPLSPPPLQGSINGPPAVLRVFLSSSIRLAFLHTESSIFFVWAQME